MAAAQVEAAASALLAKLDESTAALGAADDAELDAEAEAQARAEEQELVTLRATVRELEAQLSEEDAQMAQLKHESEKAAAALEATQAARNDTEAQMQQRKRSAARQQATSKLLQLQLTVATQLYGVAESLSHVAAAPTVATAAEVAGGGEGGDKAAHGARGYGRASKAANGAASSDWVPDVLRQRDREVDELRRALKRQQQLNQDMQRQLLEVATKKKPLGAAATAGETVDELRAAVAEQEMRRLMAEARVDELQAQVRLFEEKGLRLRLHPPPPPREAERSPGLTPAPPLRVLHTGPVGTFDTPSRYMEPSRWSEE